MPSLLRPADSVDLNATSFELQAVIIHCHGMNSHVNGRHGWTGVTQLTGLTGGSVLSQCRGCSLPMSSTVSSTGIGAASSCLA